MRAALLMLAAASLVPGSAAAAPRETALLERHRPVLRYDRDEGRFAVSVDALTAVSEIDRERGERRRVPDPGFLGSRYADGPHAEPGDRLVPARDPDTGRPLVYGREARDGQGRVWLQYWLFFTGNQQDRGIVRTGRHAGDWELLQLRLGRDRRLVEATFAQHTWAEGCAWTDVERRGAAPVVYVANGSHALYPRAGRADRPWPDPNDEADGRGRRARPPLQVVDARSPRWMAWPGRWGEDDGGWVPGEQPSPRGPAFQPDRWDDPGRFHAAEAQDCGEGPPGRPWQTGLTVVVAAALAAAGLRAARRSYNRRP
jgi:Vacuolar protein sorting-associated protein 62